MADHGTVPGADMAAGNITPDGAEVVVNKGGVEQPGSEHDSVGRVTYDWKSKRVTSTDADVLICDGPCRVGSIVNETAGEGAVIIKDDSATLMTVTVGANAVLDSIRGQRVATRLYVNSAVRPIVVQYREAVLES